MIVRFTAQIKLHSILVRTSPSLSAPKTLHLFINRDDLDFSAAEESKPVQTLELSQTGDLQEIPVRRALFGKVQQLVLFFPDNFSDGDEDVTRILHVQDTFTLIWRTSKGSPPRSLRRVRGSERSTLFTGFPHKSALAQTRVSRYGEHEFCPRQHAFVAL